MTSAHQTDDDKDIIHLLSSDDVVFPISARACQFSSFLAVALRRVDVNFSNANDGNTKHIRVPNVHSKTLSIIVEYLNHRLLAKEQKDMKLKRRLERREEGLTSSSNSDSSFCSDDEFGGFVGGVKERRESSGEKEFRVPAEEAVNVMMASNFLGC